MNVVDKVIDPFKQSRLTPKDVQLVRVLLSSLRLLSTIMLKNISYFHVFNY